MKKSALVLLVVLVFAGLQAAEAAKKSKVSDHVRALRIANSNITKGLSKVMSLNKSSSQICSVDDDEELIEDLLTCENPQILKTSCFNSEDIHSELVYRSNIVSIDCSACGQTFKVTAKIREMTHRNEAPNASTFQNYHYDFPQSEASMELIKQSCLSYIKSNKFDYSEGETSTTLEDALNNLANMNDLFELQENGFTHVVGKHQAQPELSGFVSESECKNPIDEYNEVAKYISEQKNKPSETEDTVSADPLKTHTFTMMAMVGGKPLKVKEFPQLKGSFSYEIGNQSDEQEEVEAALNHHIDPSPKRTKEDRRFKLESEDLTSKVHHLVFDQEKPDMNKLLDYMNVTVNQRGLSIISTRCEGKTEHLNVTVADPSGHSVTERYILDCKRENNRQKILSLRKIK